ncbi:TPA: transketolase [Candidatus Woesearchaeota archaeon]|nr:transketolase [Candidatus Woesearchaeota archaeon]
MKVQNRTQRTKDLALMANKLRIESIVSTTTAGSGHPTTCMSCAEIMSVLFFDELQSDDEFVLSKGHAAPILWSAYAEAGLIPRKELNNLRKITSNLEGHPTPLVPMVKIATGSLGQGLSAGVGMALGKRLKRTKSRVYVLLGDGECAEGSVWEAANAAAYYRLNNLCAIVDVNRLGQSQQTMHGHNLKAYSKKFKAFGWNTKIIDGHSTKQVLAAFQSAKKSRKPFAILAKTIKGKGISFLEDKEGWHGKPLSKEQMQEALSEIGPAEITLKSQVRYARQKQSPVDFKVKDYNIGEMVATRKAFGNALLSLGKKDQTVVALDGDVRNSTMTDAFFKQFPERSFESFIAEQNMIGMAAGLSAVGFKPFAATFGTFLTRAHDFIRMAMYSEANINIVGSHAGVSIGEDGPSQMGLEDLSMFLSMAESQVFYPCDAVSTEQLVKEMARSKGISYMRTTREGTPVLYDKKERFPPGKFKVLYKSSKDKALIIAAGETVHEALKAQESLKKKRKSVRVIDLYSVKPVDAAGLIKNAKECSNNVVVVEDHYFGGIGAVVSGILGPVKQLYVKKIPRSGKPQQLRRKYGIDAEAIVKAVNR